MLPQSGTGWVYFHQSIAHMQSSVRYKARMPGALANIDPAPLIERLARGDSLRTIAADIGVSNVGLRAWLLREEREAYQDAVTLALTHRVAEADESLDGADDNVSIARAREQCRFSRMDLERRRPHLYGTRPNTAIQVSGDGLQVQIVSYSGNNAPQHEQIIDSDTPESE